ncbi:MAG TPA: hypothetical protein VLT87_11085 [Thermoanaerobaculia bacterium]|nr:hypothetical protein [Thermoanaerobaculia bacterium]
MRRAPDVPTRGGEERDLILAILAEEPAAYPDFRLTELGLQEAAQAVALVLEDRRRTVAHIRAKAKREDEVAHVGAALDDLADELERGLPSPWVKPDENRPETLPEVGEEVLICNMGSRFVGRFNGREAHERHDLNLWYTFDDEGALIYDEHPDFWTHLPPLPAPPEEP